MRTANKLATVHPGQVLMEEFLKPLSLSIERLAQDTHVSIQHIQELVREERGVTAEMALRLARYFDMSPQFWLGLQMDYDLDVMSDTLAEQVAREVKALVTA